MYKKFNTQGTIFPAERSHTVNFPGIRSDLDTIQQIYFSTGECMNNKLWLHKLIKDHYLITIFV